jgi:hypothetical protein
MTATLNAPATLEELLAELPPDPLAHIKAGDYLPEGTINTATEECMTQTEGYGWCSREGGHPAHWKHISLEREEGRSGRVRWAWEGDFEVPELPAEIEEPPEVVQVERPASGDLMRFRNRRDILLVLGYVQKGSDLVEVLDLTHQRFRRLKVEKLVPRRDSDPEPTVEQMAWVAEFLADRKQAVAQIGLREVKSRRWSRAEMTSALKKADITPPPSKFIGNIEFNVQFELPPGAGQPSNSQLRAWMTELLKDAGNDKIKITGSAGGFYVGNLTES